MLVVFLWSVVLKYFVWSSHYVRIMLKVIVRNFLGDCIWLWTFDWWRRFQCDIWLSTAWPYIWKVLKFSFKFAGHWLLCFFLLKTISVRSLVIDCLALYLKGTEIFLFVEDDFSSIHCYRLLGLIFERYWNFLKFAGHWLLCFFLLKTISVRSLVIDCLALYLKGTDIFF